MKISDELVRTAVHEAGHVTAAIAHGFAVDVAHIRPADACHGAAVVRPAPATAGPDGAVVLAAGGVAVQLAEAEGYPVPRRTAGAAWLRRHLAGERGRRGSWRRDPAAEATRAAVTALLEDEEAQTARAAGVEPEALELARTRAGITLRQRWRMVHAIASLLLAHGEMDGATARAVWRRFEADPPPS